MLKEHSILLELAELLTLSWVVNRSQVNFSLLTTFTLSPRVQIVTNRDTFSITLSEIFVKSGRLFTF